MHFKITKALKYSRYKTGSLSFEASRAYKIDHRKIRHVRCVGEKLSKKCSGCLRIIRAGQMSCARRGANNINYSNAYFKHICTIERYRFYRYLH